MIYTKMTKEAMKIAFKAHVKQVDKAGIPYIYHPIYVAEKMNDEDSTIVALLHDVIEDTNITINNLKDIGFNEKIVEALKILTHDKNDDYYTYINKISTNDIATKVKIVDLEHNMKIERLNKITLEDLERVKKYKKCQDFLKKKIQF